MEDLSNTVSELRQAGGDRTNVEVKLAVGGMPRTIAETLSGLSNLPGGGLVLLGIDEAAGMTPVKLGDRQALKQAIAQRARTCVPPVNIDVFDATVDGTVVVAARVIECDRSLKPCRTSLGGPAFLRGYDGDFRLSELEEQAFLVSRSAPHSDRAVVEGAARADLDDELLDRWTTNVKRFDSEGLGRFGGDELLRRSGVIDALTGQITVAGLLAFGVYPQQWFPQWIIQLATLPSPENPAGIRASDAVAATGPIPVMLERAVRWASDSMPTRIIGRPDGSVINEADYPLEAFRELISNALIHRDLSPWSEGLAVEVRRTPDRLVVTNPGGLYGITVDRLGRDAVTSPRNRTLISLCRFAETTSGRRVVEALASGIQRVESELIRAQMPPPVYLDQAIRFTVLLSERKPPQVEHIPLGESASSVLAELNAGPRSTNELVASLGLPAATVRRALRALVARKLVIQDGGQGQRSTTYRRSSSHN